MKTVSTLGITRSSIKQMQNINMTLCRAKELEEEMANSPDFILKRQDTRNY
jgi:hypothetical protein